MRTRAGNAVFYAPFARIEKSIELFSGLMAAVTGSAFLSRRNKSIPWRFDPDTQNPVRSASSVADRVHSIRSGRLPRSRFADTLGRFAQAKTEAAPSALDIQLPSLTPVRRGQSPPPANLSTTTLFISRAVN